MGLEKEEAVVSMEATLKRGKRIKGNNATTGIGMASLSHSEMINAPIASTLLALASTWKGFIKKINTEIIRLIHIPI